MAKLLESPFDGARKALGIDRAIGRNVHAYELFRHIGRFGFMLPFHAFRVLPNDGISARSFGLFKRKPNRLMMEVDTAIGPQERKPRKRVPSPASS